MTSSMSYESQQKEWQVIKTVKGADVAVGGSWSLAIFAWAAELGPILNALSVLAALVASVMAGLYYWEARKLKKAQRERLERIEPDDD
ncbi:MAG: hypothetical protein AAGE92_00090 [Cyanobacteria bacterium P01_G01_bin.4]